ncbi:MAG: TetR/AcrR family transcriptional regulator [Actinobacteria bacterium]|nr:TetR/AcrR family transcriptional regulator [Actinomycetota bacterium]
MPRIAAPTVAEHAAQQQQRVFEEAVRLFGERGFENVSFADIADAVGLARNSLYRYFPTKGDILERWFRIELDARVARSTELLGGPGDPSELLTAWVEDQLDYAARPEHALLTSMARVEPVVATDARNELFGVHSRLLAPLRATLARAGVADDRLAATSELINGMILTAARYESANASPDAIMRERLHHAIASLVS